MGTDEEGGPRQHIIPVSYTHLDVYKRQRNHVCGMPNDAQLEVRKQTQEAKKRAREEGKHEKIF